MGGRRASGPRWGAITVRRLLLCLLHASFNGFFTLLVSIAGNMGGGGGGGGGLCIIAAASSHSKCSFPWVQVVGAPLLKVNWMPPIPHGKVISHTFQAFNTSGKAMQSFSRMYAGANWSEIFNLAGFCDFVAWSAEGLWRRGGDWQLNIKVLRTVMMVGGCLGI